MTEQYVRKLSCIVATDSGEGLDFASFKVQFTVRRGDQQTPNSADIRIFNLSDQTATLIAQSEFTQVSLSAGYEGNYGLIFRGTIKQFRRGRIDALDSYVDITAADGDEAYMFSPVLASVPAGTNQNGVYKQLLDSMSRFGVTQGYLPNLPSSQCIRGKVLYGSTKDELREFAWTNNCKWSLQDNALTMIPYTSYIAGGAVPVISVSTGLIGVPEQQINGIFIRTLLNPTYKIGTLVQLTSDVNQFRRSLDLPSQPANQNLQAQVHLSQDGLYYVMRNEYKGDSRGNDWYSELLCLAVDSTIVSSDAIKALTVPDNAAGSIQRY